MALSFLTPWCTRQTGFCMFHYIHSPAPPSTNSHKEPNSKELSPPDPPPDFLPTHLVLRVAPRPFSSDLVGFIHDNGTNFMSQYLTPLSSSQPSPTPSPLVHLGGIPHGQRSVPFPGCSLHPSSIYGLGGSSCVPVGSALHTPVHQHSTTSMGPRRPDPDEDIYVLHLQHGV